MRITSIHDIGETIKRARAQLGLTQAQAAALCGVSLPFMNQLEGGKRLHLSLSKVLAVCLSLGLRVQVSGPWEDAQTRA